MWGELHLRFSRFRCGTLQCEKCWGNAEICDGCDDKCCGTQLCSLYICCDCGWQLCEGCIDDVSSPRPIWFCDACGESACDTCRIFVHCDSCGNLQCGGCAELSHCDACDSTTCKSCQEQLCDEYVCVHDTCGTCTSFYCDSCALKACGACVQPRATASGTKYGQFCNECKNALLLYGRCAKSLYYFLFLLLTYNFIYYY